MAITLVGWKTKGRLLDVFSRIDVPEGLLWYPGHEVDTEKDLSFTLELLGDDAMLVLVRAVLSDLDTLGSWLNENASVLQRIETAVISHGWDEILASVEATIEWPKWPLAWLPLGDDERVYDRLEYLARRAAACGKKDFELIQAGRS